MPAFRLVTDISPRGDPPSAIEALSSGVARGERFQTLLGVTGSGKTFTMANVIARSQKPALVIAHNETLAAQLYGEFRDLFPENAVEFFVSYYDYYQPEAYLPASDTYIEKETIINDDIERMRHSATRSLRVTCLTKRMAEDLADYYTDVGVKCRYLHSDIETLERVRLVRDLRLGVFDVLIGINLLREGLDIPECSLVGVLDADKEGFLRSHVSLIQTIGRAARHPNGKAILYANTRTDSIRTAVDETNRRRRLQRHYNRAHHITPAAVRRNILDMSARLFDAAPHALPLPAEATGDLLGAEEIAQLMRESTAAMQEAARQLEFETAAWYRDRLALLREMELGLKLPARGLLEAVPPRAREARRRRPQYWYRAR